MKNKPYIIGLTGGIGCGKSEACVILESLGAYIIDADIVSRDVSAAGQKGNQELKKVFPAFFDERDNLMRRELRDYVFTNNLTGKLNEIMFPVIIDEVERRILSCDEPIVVVAAPLLIESGLHTLCDVIILVMADRAKRIARITMRDNTDSALAEKMIDSQISDDERKKLSDIVIDNNSSLIALERKIKYYYEKIKKSMEEDS